MAQTKEQAVRALLLSCGADVCGLAGIERFADAPAGFAPTDLFAGCRGVISFGVALPKGLLQVQPRLLYGRFNLLSCAQTDEIALRAAQALERDFGAAAVPVPCDAPYEVWDEETKTGRGLLSMKHIAVRCGLGTLGKNTLLLNPRFGNRLTVGAILIDQPLESDPLCAPVCIEGCRKCVERCPVGAIRDGAVRQDLCRANTYGQTARGFDTVDCNVCRASCPRRYGVD